MTAVARDPDFGRGKAMNLDRWLDEGRFQPWMAASAVGDGGSAKATWSGPASVREAVEAVMGAGAVASYLDPAKWDEARRVVLTASRLAADRLKADVGRALAASDVRIEFAGSAPRG